MRGRVLRGASCALLFAISSGPTALAQAVLPPFIPPAGQPGFSAPGGQGLPTSPPPEVGPGQTPGIVPAPLQTTPQTLPPVVQPTPPVRPDQPSGRWVLTRTYGWVWVPFGRPDR